jgi:predicted alpha/beta-fold hydrolase
MDKLPNFVLNNRFLTNVWLGKSIIPNKHIVLHGDGCTSRLDIYNHNTNNTKCVIVFPGRNELECYWRQLIDFMKNSPITFVVWHRRGEFDNSICYNYPYIYNESDIDDVINYIENYSLFYMLYGLGLYIGGNILLKYIASKSNLSSFHSVIAVQPDINILNKCSENKELQTYSCEVAKRCVNLNKDLLKKKYSTIFEQEEQFINSSSNDICEYYTNLTSDFFNKIQNVSCNTTILDYIQCESMSPPMYESECEKHVNDKVKKLFVDSRADIFKTLRNIITNE